MAEVTQWKTDVSLTVAMILPEDEARALKWLAGCGADALWRFVETNYGSQASRHKDAMKSLVSSLNTELGQTLARADKAREAFNPKPVSSAYHGPGSCGLD